MRKCTVLVLITCLVVSSLIVLAVTPVTVQAAPKPSVPQFTVKLIDHSYDVLPSTTTVIDPYIGSEYTYTKPGYRVVDREIEVTIKNQPFTPYTDTDNTKHELRYKIQYKGHFEENWKTFPSYYSLGTVPSDSGYTVVSDRTDEFKNLVTGSQLDFRVEAVIGHVEYIIPYPEHPLIFYIDFINDASSGWSKIQTITIPGETTSSSTPSQTTPLPTPTVTPLPTTNNSQPQFPGQTQPPNGIFTNPFFLFGTGALFAGVIIVVVMVFLRRHIKTPTYANNNSTQTNTNTEL